MTAVGLQFAQNGEYKKAVNEFSSLLSQDLTHGDAFFYRACAYLHLGEYDKAINDFNSAISSLNLSTRHDLPALYKRGYAYFKTNQLDSALDDYRDYLSQCKTHEANELIHKGLFQMGIIYAELNRHDRAISYFDNAIKKSSKTEEDAQKLYYLHRGRAHACCAQYDEAQEDLLFVLERSNDPFIKGCANNELGRHEDALKEFDDLLQSNGKKSQLVQTCNDHILFRRGLSYASLDSHDKALTDFHHALDSSHTQPSSSITDRILFRRAISNMALQNTREALKDFNNSTKLNASQSDVFYARGMLQYTLGRHDAAVYDQRKAIALDGKSAPSAPIHKTIHYTNKYDGDHHVHMYYENKIREAEELLKKNEGNALTQAAIHRMIAEYLQKKAQHSNDPSSTHNKAREHTRTAIGLSNGSEMADSVALAVNSLYRAHRLAEKYSNGDVPRSVIEEYIKYAAESILDMSKLFDKCIIERNWDKLLETLYNESDKSNAQRQSNFDKYRNTYITNQLEKAKMIQDTMEMFADSPQQQEFYVFLVTRLCNLFDAARTASTGIFQHALEGTLTKVSWIFKLLGSVFEYVPISSQVPTKVFGLCEAGFKQVDEIRIQNALNRVATCGTPTMLNKTADEIAKNLTIMYENQIKRFPITSEESAAAANSDQQKSTASCSCAGCCKRCCGCLSRQKNRIFNETEKFTMETIVEYASSLFLSRFIRLEIIEIKTMKDIENVFVNGVCRPSKLTVFYLMELADKIKPIDAKTDDERWDTYDFFRRPVIKFENNEVRAQKDKDEIKFGWRKSSEEEEHLLKQNPKKLEDDGFKKVVKKDSTE